MKRTFAYIGIVIFVGCTIGSNSYVNKNENIPIEQRNKIKEITDSIFECFESKNYDFIKKTVDSNLIPNVGSFDTLFNRIDLTGGHKSVYEQFFIRNTPISKIDNVPSEHKNYRFGFIVRSAYTYIYLFSVHGKDLRSTWMVTCVFNKNNLKSAWKLGYLYLDQYLYDNKSPTDYYHLAKEYFDNGKYLDAYFTMHVSYNLLNPGGSGFHYSNEKEIAAFAQKMLTITKEKNLLPITISEIASHPKLKNISTSLYNGRLVSLLTIESTSDTSDTIAIKKEGYKIGKYISDLIPEFKTVGDSTIYQFISPSNSNLGYSQRYSFISANK